MPRQAKMIGSVPDLLHWGFRKIPCFAGEASYTQYALLLDGEPIQGHYWLK